MSRELQERADQMIKELKECLKPLSREIRLMKGEHSSERDFDSTL